MEELILFGAGGLIGAAVMFGYMRGVRKAVKHERDMAGDAIARERDTSTELHRRVTSYAVGLERMRADKEVAQAYRDGIVVGRQEIQQEIADRGYEVITK